MRALVQGNMLGGESISSDKSYSAELEAQAAQQFTMSRRIAWILVGLLACDIIFFCIGISISVLVTDATYFRVQVTLMAMVFINSAIYLSVTFTLKKFLRQHYSNKFELALKSITRLCYLLLV